MCIYCTTTNYRKIYKEHYGPIPKEKDGKSYEIHHIDGDHSNNDPANLKAVTIEEHYNIHYSQGDWYACTKIAGKLNFTHEEISELARKSALQRVELGTHNFLGKNNPSHKRVADGTHNLQGKRNPSHKRLENGTHHFLNSNFQKNVQNKLVENGTHHFLGGEVQKNRVKDGTHPFLGGEIQRITQNKLVDAGTHHLLNGEIQRKANAKRLENGTHNFLDSDFQRKNAKKRIENGTHHFLGPNSSSQWEWVCQHCGKSGKGKGAFNLWHNFNCKSIK